MEHAPFYQYFTVQLLRNSLTEEEWREISFCEKLRHMTAIGNLVPSASDVVKRLRTKPRNDGTRKYDTRSRYSGTGDTKEVKDKRANTPGKKEKQPGSKIEKKKKPIVFLDEQLCPKTEKPDPDEEIVPKIEVDVPTPHSPECPLEPAVLKRVADLKTVEKRVPRKTVGASRLGELAESWTLKAVWRLRDLVSEDGPFRVSGGSRLGLRSSAVCGKEKPVNDRQPDPETWAPEESKVSLDTSNKENLGTPVSLAKSKRFFCQQCGYGTGYKVNLNRHVTAVHDKVKRFKCEECDYKSSYKRHLVNHITAVHTRLRPHECDRCGYRASNKSNLRQHRLNVHERSERFACAECPYRTNYAKNLERHTRVVHKAAGAKKAEVAKVQRALAVRNKDKSYSCGKCDFETAYKENLNRHVSSVHDKVKPYECGSCPYKTSYKRQLVNHVSAVHDHLRPHACATCGYRATTQSNLRQHRLNVHERSERFACAECAYRTNYVNNLRRHTRALHNGRAEPTGHT
ncbi:hypothetical protein AAG570_007085 [Ranatra chinensis]|uniref:C2H2-type domain-containing protein n=1 Tax=Ranatra chinensis TaxID=642074 RepID=A0ABD0YDE6_9HEMI